MGKLTPKANFDRSQDVAEIVGSAPRGAGAGGEEGRGVTDIDTYGRHVARDDCVRAP